MERWGYFAGHGEMGDNGSIAIKMANFPCEKKSKTAMVLCNYCWRGKSWLPYLEVTRRRGTVGTSVEHSLRYSFWYSSVASRPFRRWLDHVSLHQGVLCDHQ